MWAILIWIVVCYAIAAMAVHIAAKRRKERRPEAHYVLLADNEAERMEWYLRRLLRWSRRSGHDVRVTVIDCGTDDTSAIADRFAKRLDAVTVVRPQQWDVAAKVSASTAGRDTGFAAALLEGEKDAASAAECDVAREYEDSVMRFKELRERLQSDEGDKSEEPFWWRIEDASYGNPGRTVLVDLSDPADVAMLP